MGKFDFDMRLRRGRGAFSGIIKESIDYSDYNKEDLILKIEPAARLVCSKIYKFWKEHYNESRAVSKDNIKILETGWGLNYTQIKGLTDSYKAFEESLGVYGSIIKIYADEVSDMDERSLKSIFLETDETGRNFFYLSISGIKALTESADKRNEIYNQCCSKEIHANIEHLTLIDESGKMLEKFVNAFFYENFNAELEGAFSGNAMVTAEQSPLIPFKYKKILVVK